MKVEVDLAESSVVLPRVGKPKEMISVSKLEDGRTLVRINSSSVGIIQECLRKASYSLDQKWRSENESPATVFGSAVHKALEVFYTGDPAHRKLPSYEQMELMSYGHRVDGEESDLLLRATRAFLEAAAPLSALPEGDKRSPQSGMWILWHYFKAYLNDPYVALIDDEGPFVERDFTFLIDDNESMRVEYFGRIDLVVQHVETKEILVADHKTSSMVGSEFYNRLKPNGQYTGYLLGAKNCFGLETNSFLVNCLEVKPKPKTARGSPPHFPRQVTTRDEVDYAEFREVVLDCVSRYTAALDSGRFPLGHVNSCATYGGCSFLSVCSAPSQLRENILNAKFTKGLS